MTENKEQLPVLLTKLDQEYEQLKKIQHFLWSGSLPTPIHRSRFICEL